MKRGLQGRYTRYIEIMNQGTELPEQTEGG